MSRYRKELRGMLAPDFDRDAHLDAGSFEEVTSSPIGNRAPKFIGEELFNSTGKVFYKGTGLGVNDWYTGSGGGGLSDGDYGDISVTSGGTAMNLDNDVVTNAKLANMATQKIKGRNTTGTGDPEDLDPSVVFTMLGLGTAAQANTGAFAAASHTHLASTISDATTAGRGMLTAANVAAQQALLSVDDLVALSGVNDGVQNLGTFTGTTIADNLTIKAALQALETALEAVGSGDNWELAPTSPASNPTSPYTLPNSSGNAVTRITALAGNLTINKPSSINATANVRYWRIVIVAATGADRTLTWGTGITLGLGVQPSLVVVAGTTAYFALYTDDGGTSWQYDGDTAVATETVAGRIEIATTAEINTGTDATRAVAPDQLAGSYAGTKSVSMMLTVAQADAHVTGDGQASFVIPPSLNGMNLVGAGGTVRTAGTTGDGLVQLRRRRSGSDVDMLSTRITFANGATASSATAINASNDDVATGDIIYVDIDQLSSTPAQGGAVWLEFRLP